MRGLLRQALEHLAVPQTVIEEIVLALTEACANVVDHVHDQEAYQVEVSIDDELCRISVLDQGEGFDPGSVQTGGQPTDAERGRGLILMNALVDRLQFVQDDDGHHRVTFEKRLVPQQPHLRLLQS
ncbi:serine/threonine-protein kinase RsbW [Blastococcus saxobsidens]|uniref:Serine/threonine-protein kinase RsbW n=1 Tax=Blastococcus saxobsidens TaxID=138336 RepID=A0A4Q7Y8I4_9ACTN|nr:serine/threonine-protein kinase RsbW [Blastococcus saxobsidens]